MLHNAGGSYERCQLGGTKPVEIVNSHDALFVDCELRSAKSKRVPFTADNPDLTIDDGLLSGTVHDGANATVQLT
jgi:hypothetical protein